MNTIKSLGLAAILASCASFAQAETGLYGGASVLLGSYEENGVESVDLNFIQAQVGNRFNENWAIEGRVGLGIGDDSVTTDGVKIELEGEYLVSVFAKGILPINPSFELYALAGLTYSSIEANASFLGNSAKVSDSGSDVSFGLGASFDATESVSLFAEYSSIYDKDDTEFNGFTLGINSRF